MNGINRAPNRNPALRRGFVRRWTWLLLAMPGLVMAQAAPDFGGTDSKVTGFLQNINGLLNLASIAVVTIAVIFAGYQIAFAHKRISDVAPILIGGFLIGAAAQIAKMLVGDTGGAVAMVMHVLPALYA
ncbi:TrbC/VirB2 family protein [Cognatiluteimonas profundi]|uniref:TrbC/VirB2 family protein n=1 Tax=Cognatiluteimonas profundi TaxID=2594501 RepID=UPI00131AAB9E|nr:TrbC/VirB2 family protein [Lysobacter profundi]